MDTADCVRPTRLAARVKLPSSAMKAKARSSAGSITGRGARRLGVCTGTGAGGAGSSGMGIIIADDLHQGNSFP